MISAPKLIFQVLPPVVTLGTIALAYLQTPLLALVPLCLMTPVVILNWILGIRAKTIRQHLSAFILSLLLPILLGSISLLKLGEGPTKFDKRPRQNHHTLRF